MAGLDSLIEDLNHEGAFGDPDGSRENPDRYVSSSRNRTAQTGGSPLRARVIVGRKGSGKTLYLRHIQRLIQENESLIVLPLEDQQTLMQSKHVSDLDRMASQWERLEDAEGMRLISEIVQEDYLTEVWQVIWSRAIFASLASRCLFEGRIRNYLATDDVRRIRSILNKLSFGVDLVPEAGRSPFTYVKSFIDATREASGGDYQKFTFLNTLLNNPKWDDLAAIVAEALADAPPIVMFIDAVDEEFAHNPTRWLRCQKGLFYATMRQLRSTTAVSGRLHIVISIRDVVLSSVFKSEHATRYRASPHILSLNWDVPSAVHLLRTRVRTLNEEYWLVGSTRPQTIAEWLGVETVTCRSGVSEPVETYLIRHTQVLPRDIILMGNFLGDEVRRAKASGQGRLTEDDVRRVVENVGKACGTAQLIAAANQAASEGFNEEPEKFAVHRAGVEYLNPRFDTLAEIIRSLSTLRFKGEGREILRQRGVEAFKCEDLPSVLWQLGLLGYREDGHDVFHRSDFMGAFVLPVSRDYVLHPSMIECVGVRPTEPLVDIL